MYRYWTAVTFIFLTFLAIFLVAEQGPALFLSVPQQLAAMPSGSAGVVGTSLLVADVVLPVPSSLVMVAHGAIFGVGVGTVLSVLGSLGAALVGFALGRSGSPLLNRFVPPHEQDRANQLLAKWGLLAIVLTRSVPLMAETTAVMAGASPMIGWRGMTLASVAGSLPIALIYAVTGATAMLLDSTMLTVGLVLLVAGLFWLLERYGLPILQTQKSMSFPKEIL